MSEGGGLSNPIKELIVIILIFLGIGFLWLSTGGMKKINNTSNVSSQSASSTTETKGSFWNFFKPIDLNATSSLMYENPNSNYGIDSWYNDTNNNSEQTNNNSNAGTTKPPTDVTYNSYQRDLIYYGSEKPVAPSLEEPDKILVDSVTTGGIDQNGESEEYLSLYASETNKKKFLISGLTLKSRMTGKQAQIGEGTGIYYSNNINSKSPIFLAPGERAYIITRRSPVGYSFKVNKCMGYLTQYQDFFPGISSNCPLLSDYPYPESPNAFTDQCLDFLDSVGSCQTVTNEDFPEGLRQDCINFSLERTNYARCVADFSNTKDFLSNEWMVYLGRTENLWKDRREIIDIIDSKGKILQTYTY